MVWKQMVLKSLFFNSGQTTPTPTIQATWCLAGRGLHENVPTVLSFVCRAPFSKAAGETPEAGMASQECLYGPASYPPSNSPAGLKERMWQKTHLEGGNILRALYQYHCFL